VHTNRTGAYILSEQNNFPHANIEELIAFKIPILSGVGAGNTFSIMEYLATNGPSLKYDVFKNLKFSYYPTVSRRIDDLRNKRYIAESGKRITERGKQKEESMYGLTWRGFIASLSSEKVRKDVIGVLKRNPLLTLPEKESILIVLSEITTQEELEVIARAVFEAYLNAIPNLELINDDQLWTWLLAIREPPNLPTGFKLTKMPENALELLDRPIFLQVVKERIIPIVKKTVEQLALAYKFFKIMGTMGEFIEHMNEDEKPSIQVKNYLENHLPKILSDEKD
jgi:hypothetical protein